MVRDEKYYYISNFIIGISDVSEKKRIMKIVLYENAYENKTKNICLYCTLVSVKV